MSQPSYREYLDILKGPSTQKKVFKSIFLTIFIALFLVVGTVSSLFFYYKKNIEPQIIASDFIQSTSVGFISTKQSLNDVLDTFQVAGEKVSVIDKLQNSQNSEDGYFVDLQDKQKLLEKIRVAKENIEFQKGQLQKTKSPTEFNSLTQDLVNYYSQSEILLSQTQKNHEYFKNMLLALGPDFYLPILSSDAAWNSQDPQKVLAYYEDKRTKAQDALTSVAKLSPQPDFTDYYQDEIAYLELFANLSGDITSILKTRQEQKPDEAQPLEKAYQKLINAQSKNSVIASRLLSEKQRLLLLNENLDKFAAVRFQGNSLESRIKEENAKFQNDSSLIPTLVKFIHSRIKTT